MYILNQEKFHFFGKWYNLKLIEFRNPSQYGECHHWEVWVESGGWFFGQEKKDGLNSLVTNLTFRDRVLADDVFNSYKKTFNRLEDDRNNEVDLD